MERDTIAREVASRLGGTSEAEVLTMLTAILVELGRDLPAHERATLREALPRDLAALVTADSTEPSAGIGSLRARVAQRAGVHAGYAEEALEVFGAVLAERLGAERAGALARRVGPPLAAWLEPGVPADAPAGTRRRAYAVAMGRHLSGAHPGETRGLAAARPDRTQSGSIAREDDPHEASKLASGAATQQREHGDLATGRPGSGRPIAGRRE